MFLPVISLLQTSKRAKVVVCTFFHCEAFAVYERKKSNIISIYVYTLRMDEQFFSFFLLDLISS